MGWKITKPGYFTRSSGSDRCNYTKLWRVTHHSAVIASASSNRSIYKYHCYESSGIFSTISKYHCTDHSEFQFCSKSKSGIVATFSNSGFAQTFSPTLNSNFDANPQQSSLMALMSESLYNWPNQDQQGLGDEDLFDFSGLQNLSGMNNFNSDTNIYSLLDMNVRLVLLCLQIIIHIHSSPQLCLLQSGTAKIPTATLLQISTCFPRPWSQHWHSGWCQHAALHPCSQHWHSSWCQHGVSRPCSQHWHSSWCQHSQSQS